MDSDIKLQLSELIEIYNQNPHNYRELNELKNKLNLTGSTSSAFYTDNEEKMI